jgi:hypothetical protein
VAPELEPPLLDPELPEPLDPTPPPLDPLPHAAHAMAAAAATAAQRTKGFLMDDSCAASEATIMPHAAGGPRTESLAPGGFEPGGTPIGRNVTS